MPYSKCVAFSLERGNSTRFSSFLSNSVKVAKKGTFLTVCMLAEQSHTNIYDSNSYNPRDMLKNIGLK